jgi:hypothetical protein
MFQHQFLLPAALIAGAVAAPAQTSFDSFAPLRFTRDGTFQISVFNDLHYGEGTRQPNATTVLFHHD